MISVLPLLHWWSEETYVLTLMVCGNKVHTDRYHWCLCPCVQMYACTIRWKINVPKLTFPCNQSVLVFHLSLSGWIPYFFTFNIHKHIAKMSLSLKCPAVYLFWTMEMLSEEYSIMNKIKTRNGLNNRCKHEMKWSAFRVIGILSVGNTFFLAFEYW